MGNKSGIPMTSEEKAQTKVASKVTKALEKDMQESACKDRGVNKLLLLGAGGSGKSTLFKQMTTIYGEGFSEERRAEFARVVYGNTILSMQVLIKNVPKYGNIDTDGAPGVVVASASKEAVMGVQATETEIDSLMGEHLKTLWLEESVQAAYTLRSNFQLPDSCRYFMEHIDEIAADDYVPDTQHVMRCRTRTTGIVENEFTISTQKFKIFDVGGQRNERKKWIHCFDDVTAVLFVGVLSEYDLVLFEHENMNRFEETLELFERTIRLEVFAKTAFILFLNKRDLFEEKIALESLALPLSQSPVFKDRDEAYFAQFPDNTIDNYDNGVEAIKWEFITRKPEGAVIYTHVTCATDTKAMQVVFNAVKEIIIRGTMEDAGLF